MGRMSLKNASSGPVKKPPRVVLYGPEGIGKSTFGANAPSPIFLGAEDGTSELDVTRYPEPESWGDVMEAIDDLRSSDHQYKTLVIDTLDWIEPLLIEVVCKEGNKEAIGDFDWGKGTSGMVDKWRTFLFQLDMLRRDKGMTIILLAHCHIKRFNNPEGEDYDRYELKISKKSAELIKEWADGVLFTTYETFTRQNKEKKVKAVSNGSRIVHTERRAAFDAKNRWGLPPEFPLGWNEFQLARKLGPGAPGKLQNEAREVIGSLTNPETVEWANKALGRAGDDPLKLYKLVDVLRGKKDLQ